MSDYILSVIQVTYLIAASLFIIGLHDLNSPESARRGNKRASAGMLIAVVATLLSHEILNYEMIFVGILVGSLVGAVAARRVRMTAMPQMVGLFNGFGGGASALVATGEFWRLTGTTETVPYDTMLTIVLGLLIGGVTFAGSLIAFGKLQGTLTGKPITFPLHQHINGLLLLSFMTGGAYLIISPMDKTLFLVLVGISLVLGLLFVIPIGGADMPVVISLLNSFSGLAASAAGFILGNNVLIVSGALVGAAGMILTRLMSKAMNRSLANVLFGAFGKAATIATTEAEKAVRSIDAEEGAMVLAYAGSVVIVPGYGMAAARAQHAVRDLAEQLEKRNVEVKYAIHPVAGRMPGHMNVLLAEADVPYTQLYDMEDINPEFERTDVALVIGASDVVNPAARHATKSPI
ncbi:MAG: NAD(P)(+) transhydrogenase (Re/Si-specific) subunit beta, partial [Candidatus Hydrothermarchaeales archaeon]